MRLLITGVARSGTTWIAETLAATGARYVHEPDNSGANPAAAAAEQRLGSYPVLEPGAEAPDYASVWDLAFAGGWPDHRAARSIGRLTARVPAGVRDPGLDLVSRVARRLRRPPRCVIVKSVHCAFAIEWLVERYRPRVLLVRRDPLDVVASLIRLKTTLEHMRRIEPLWQHPYLRRCYLDDLGIGDPPADGSLAARVAWWVGFSATVYDLAATRHPEWVVVRHDALCEDAPAEFRRLAAALGMEWSAAADQHLERSNRPGEGFVTRRVRGEVGQSWRRVLTPDQAADAHAVLSQFPGAVSPLATGAVA